MTSDADVLAPIAPAADGTDQPATMELLLPAQKQSLEMIVRGAPLAEVLAFLTRIVERHAGGRAIAAILLLDEEGCLRDGAAPSLPDEYNKAIDGLKASPDLGTCSVAAATGKVVITPDIAADPKWASIASLPLGLGLKAAWSQPILARDGNVLGTFGTYFRECRPPTAFERQLVETLSQTAALAIERSAADRSLERQRRLLDVAMDAASMGAWRFTMADSMVEFSPRAQQLYGLPARFLHDEAGVRTFIHPEDIAGMWAAVRAATTPGGNGRYEVQYRVCAPAGSWRWLSVWGMAEFEGQGAARRAVAITGASRDITDRKEAERQHQLLVDELSHRVKNTLAVVQSIAAQTLRRTTDPAVFRQAFGARISALARAHSLLTRGLWRGAPLTDIADVSLDPFRLDGGGDCRPEAAGTRPDAAAPDCPITFRGPAVTVPPSVALTLSLVLHELGTNAVKHGALGRPGGTVALRWERAVGADGEATLALAWTERGGPPVPAIRESGFGCKLIAASAAQLGGEADMRFGADGLECVLRFPCAA